MGNKAQRETGDRLARVLRVAMAQAGIETWYQLGDQSGVSPTTIDNWIYGVTTPRAHHLGKVAKRLAPHVSAGDLERAAIRSPERLDLSRAPSLRAATWLGHLHAVIAGSCPRD